MDFKKSSPFLIHIFMVISVTVYTIFGAYVIRAIENSSINEINRQNGYSDGQRQIRTKRSGDDIVLTGPELAAVAPGLRPCVQQAIRELLALGECSSEELKTLSITAIDDCYRFAEINLNGTQKVVNVNKEVDTRQRFGSRAEDKEELGWTLHNSIVFTFTLITTVGYGHVAPTTTTGQLFCLIYGIIGIPLALITIADIGMFLNKIVKQFLAFLTASYIKFKKWRRQMKKSKSAMSSARSNNEIKTPTTMNGSIADGTIIENEGVEDEEQIDDEIPKRRSSESILLAIIFFIYLFVGSLLISIYEPEMSFFTAFYFNFISLTTIGLGDIIPKNTKYLALTGIYLTVGLALTTIIIEIAAEFLKKVHYFGRKLGDVATTDVYFGGKKMQLKNLVKHLGDQLNIPIEELQKFDINAFVEDSIKVASGELKSLKKFSKAFLHDDLKIIREKLPSNVGDEEFISYTSEETPLQTARSATSAKQYQKSQSAR